MRIMAVGEPSESATITWETCQDEFRMKLVMLKLSSTVSNIFGHVSLQVNPISTKEGRIITGETG